MIHTEQDFHITSEGTLDAKASILDKNPSYIEKLINAAKKTAVLVASSGFALLLLANPSAKAEAANCNRSNSDQCDPTVPALPCTEDSRTGRWHSGAAVHGFIFENPANIADLLYLQSGSALLAAVNERAFILQATTDPNWRQKDAEGKFQPEGQWDIVTMGSGPLANGWAVNAATREPNKIDPKSNKFFTEFVRTGAGDMTAITPDGITPGVDWVVTRKKNDGSIRLVKNEKGATVPERVSVRGELCPKCQTEHISELGIDTRKDQYTANDTDWGTKGQLVAPDSSKLNPAKFN